VRIYEEFEDTKGVRIEQTIRTEGVGIYEEFEDTKGVRIE
jgi:hypothetical protein